MGFFRAIKGAFRQRSSITQEDIEIGDSKSAKIITYIKRKSSKGVTSIECNDGSGRSDPSTLPILKFRQQCDNKGYDNRPTTDSISCASSDNDGDHVSAKNNADDDQYPWDPLWKQQQDDACNRSTRTSPLTPSPRSCGSRSKPSSRKTSQTASLRRRRRRGDPHERKYWVRLPLDKEYTKEETKKDKKTTSNKNMLNGGIRRKQLPVVSTNEGNHAVLFSNIRMLPSETLKETTEVGRQETLAKNKNMKTTIPLLSPSPQVPSKISFLQIPYSSESSPNKQFEFEEEEIVFEKDETTASPTSVEDDSSSPSDETDDDDVMLKSVSNHAERGSSPTPQSTGSFTDIIRSSPTASLWESIIGNNITSNNNKTIPNQDKTQEVEEVEEDEYNQEIDLDQFPCPSTYAKPKVSVDEETTYSGPPPPLYEIRHHRRSASDSSSDISSLGFPEIPKIHATVIQTGGLKNSSSRHRRRRRQTRKKLYQDDRYPRQNRHTNSKSAERPIPTTSSNNDDSHYQNEHLSLLKSLACAALDDSPVESLSSFFHPIQEKNNEFGVIDEDDQTNSIIPRIENHLRNKTRASPTSSTTSLREQDRVKNSTSSTNSTDSTKNKCLVLLMEPETKIFEVVRIPYKPEETTLGDLLQLVRHESTDERLARQTYTGLAHDGIHITAPMVPIDLIITAKVASEAKVLYSGEEGAATAAPVLLAVPKNYSAAHVESMAEKLLATSTVHRLLELDHYASASIQLPTKTATKMASHHNHHRRHPHRHHRHRKDINTVAAVVAANSGAASGYLESSGAAAAATAITAVSAATLGEQVVAWATQNYGTRIRLDPSYTQAVAM